MCNPIYEQFWRSQTISTGCTFLGSPSGTLALCPIRIFLCNCCVFTPENEDVGQIKVFVISVGIAHIWLV